jgi:hypothetical protein
MENIIDKTLEKIVENMPPELTLAIMAGCELEHFYDAENQKYIIKTKYPIQL